MLWTDNGETSNIVINDLDYSSSLLLLEYIYTDRIQSIEDGDTKIIHNIVTLLKFAEKFSLHLLMNYLCRAMADKMKLTKGTSQQELNVNMVQELLEFSTATNSDYLTLKCKEYLLFMEGDNTPRQAAKKPKKRTGCIIS